MPITRTESRSRVGITWYDSEAEADAAAKRMLETVSPESAAAANLGYVQIGRDRAFDLPGEYAVVTP